MGVKSIIFSAVRSYLIAMAESLSKILPAEIFRVLGGRLNLERLYELRLRANRPVSVNYGGRLYFLSEGGLSTEPERALIASPSMVNDVVVRGSDFSLYAVNDQLKAGFLTIRGGVRIGVAGETVLGSHGEVSTVKNFTSVNIRIPHEVKNAADKLYKFCCQNGVHNTLIVSPPGAGKTTVLRDLARRLGNQTPPLNILVADERNELAASHMGAAQLDIGIRTDVIANCSKAFAFSAGIRAMAPDVIITDELSGAADAAAVEYAAASGVKIIASAHATDHLDIMSKPGFEGLIKKRVFSRYTDLSVSLGPGTVDGIFDADFNAVYRV